MSIHTPDYAGQSLGNDVVDISPDFVPNRTDAAIVRRIGKLQESPRAIKEFARECHKLSDYSYWFLLGTLWVCYTGWSDLQQWKWLFSSNRPKRETSLMKPSELKVWRNLPETIVAYRAPRIGEQDWISYTIDPNAALRFATERGSEHIDTYEFARCDALCIFTRRVESEIIVIDRMNVRHIKRFDRPQIGGVA